MRLPSEKESRKRWPHLFSEAFEVRREMAAKYAKGLNVIEIGPAGLFTPCDKEYVAIDDLAEFSLSQVKKPYALVALGLDIEGRPPDFRKALQLASDAQIVILETASDHAMGQQQMARLLEVAPGTELAREKLNLKTKKRGKRLFVVKGKKASPKTKSTSKRSAERDPAPAETAQPETEAE